MLNQGEEQAANDARTLRLLIQQVQTGSGKSWRLIVYGDGDRHRAPEFATLDDLLAVLRNRVPHLDVSNIAVPRDGSGASVIYAADVQLTRAQRTALGLISVSTGKAAL